MPYDEGTQLVRALYPPLDSSRLPTTTCPPSLWFLDSFAFVLLARAWSLGSTIAPLKLGIVSSQKAHSNTSRSSQLIHFSEILNSAYFSCTLSTQLFGTRKGTQCFCPCLSTHLSSSLETFKQPCILQHGLQVSQQVLTSLSSITRTLWKQHTTKPNKYKTLPTNQCSGCQQGILSFHVFLLSNMLNWSGINLAILWQKTQYVLAYLYKYILFALINQIFLLSSFYY